jgi:exodeoxyribonuclease V beta subunit
MSTETPDVDLPDRDMSLAATEPDLISPADRDASDIYSFPRGTRAGSFFHDVFEHYDFGETNPESLETLVAEKLQQYGLESKWQQTVCRTINKVLAITLRPDLPQLKLSTVRMADRVNEMEFYFPLKHITPGHLKNVFGVHSRAEISADFPTQLEKLTFAPTAGFMKGYIDMVFEHRGRFYLVDWKSNHLGPTLEHYGQAALFQTMQADFYILQYHLYTLALHQFLRLRKRDYSYGKHFGGVFYIYLRGIDDTRGPQYGIFFDLPDTKLVQALGEALIPGY